MFDGGGPVQHYDGLLVIAVGIVTIVRRKQAAREVIRFWGTPDQKAQGPTRGLELFHGFVGVVFVFFGLIRLFNQ